MYLYMIIILCTDYNTKTIYKLLLNENENYPTTIKAKFKIK